MKNRTKNTRKHLAALLFSLTLAASFSAAIAQTPEAPIVIQNSAMQERDDKGGPRGWTLSKETSPSDFVFVRDGETAAIRHGVVGEYRAANQSLRLKPDTKYRLTARVRGTTGGYIRARSTPVEGAGTRPYDVQLRASIDYVPVSFEFSSGYNGVVTLIIGSAENNAPGEIFITDIAIREAGGAVQNDSEGAIPLRLNEREVLRVRKLPVADARSVRGFMGAAVDGKTDTFSWNGAPWEYNMASGGVGVRYEFRDNDGLHLTLPQAQRVDAVRVRGGAQVNLFGAGADWRGPQSAPLLHAFGGIAATSLGVLKQPVETNKLSFFDLQNGTIADVSLLQIERGTGDLPAPQNWQIGEAISEIALQSHRDARFTEGQRATFSLQPNAARGVLNLPANSSVHLITSAQSGEVPLAAIGFDARAIEFEPGTVLSVSVQDPINPRAELIGAEFALSGEKNGRLQFVLDFPDQILPRGGQLWLTVRANRPLKLAGENGGAPTVQLFRVEKARALPEAIAYRKMLLKTQFQALSEPRPWGRMPVTGSFDEWFKKEVTGEALRELYETTDHARAIATDDDIVRQYYEWLYRRRLVLEPVARVDAVPGAPEWAVVARQAWLEARKIPQWWLENRSIPDNGEFGGVIGDDTDMYQNFSVFPMFEDDGLTPLLKERAARFLELAESRKLTSGINSNSTDPLHAYEDGVNHIALMSWWNYGDPVYFERAMESARSMESTTIKTAQGHRHFKSQKMGAADLRAERATDFDGGYHSLMLHPALEVARYNRNPRALNFVREWADSWLAHQTPGQWISAVEVATEKSIDASTPGTKAPAALSYGGMQAQVLAALSDITGDKKYLQPMRMMHEAENHRRYLAGVPMLDAVPDLWHRDAVTVSEEIKARNGVTAALETGDKAPLIDRLKSDIANLQHFPHISTDAEMFTDRIFLYQAVNPSIVYTGGFTTRNKLHNTHAVSYKGFGTDYAAMVLRNKPDSFKVLLYNFAAQPQTGNLTFWNLENGRYNWTLGPDTNGDDTAESTPAQGTAELQRASELPVTLPPGQVMVLEITQTQKLNDALARADLALSASEIKIEGDAVTGVAHNIGGAAANCEVALIDPSGKVVARQAVGEIAAPLDLTPQRKPFRFNVAFADTRGWKVALDFEGEIPEIYEGNNSIALPAP